jgi:hypothetical protein
MQNMQSFMTQQQKRPANQFQDGRRLELTFLHRYPRDQKAQEKLLSAITHWAAAN